VDLVGAIALAALTYLVRAQSLAQIGLQALDDLLDRQLMPGGFSGLEAQVFVTHD
jgi:hypothetical protein